jgi:predicted HTH domain antitoxin
MAITITLPPDLENELRKEFPDLEQAAKESLFIESYRTGRISLGTLAEGMGLPTTVVAQEWLASRGVALNYGTEDFEQDLRTIDRLFRRGA